MAKQDRATPNKLPVVVIETPTNVGYVDTPFQINLTLSYDPDGEIVRTVIQWGDASENTAMGRPEWASHRYEHPGSYIITVACMDDQRDIHQLAFGTALVDIIVPIPFEVEDQQYQEESPDGQPVQVALDQAPVVTGGVAPYDAPVYDPDDLPADDLFPVGETVVKFYVEDAHGQRAWGEAYVTVVDTTPPPVETLVVTAPADEYITTPGQQAQVEWDDATVVGGVPPYVLRYEANGAQVRSGISFFSVGATVVTAIAQDARGMQATDTFTITVEHVSPIPPGNNDAYFASRKAHPSCVFNYALTSDAEIAKYRKQAYNAYQPYYDAAMNAMRISIPPGTQGSISNQMWLPCSLAEAGQLVFIWEEFDGPNWNAKGGFTGWKYYQIRRDADKIWFEIGAGPAAEPYALGKARIRQYATVGPNTILGNYQVTDEYGSRNYNTDSVRSAVNAPRNYNSLLGQPTRHMIVATQDPADPRYVSFDYYASDPDHPVLLIHQGVEVACPNKAGQAGLGRPRHFDWEINTSLSRPSPGPEACMWARYMTIHRGVADPLSLFQPITGW